MLRFKSLLFLVFIILGLFIIAGVNTAVRSYNEMDGRTTLPPFMQAKAVDGGYEISFAGHRVKLPDGKTARETWQDMTRRVSQPLKKAVEPYGNEGLRLTRIFYSEWQKTVAAWKDQLRRFRERFSRSL